MNVKREYPNISLGTVYRNLSLLADLGEIQRLQVGDGVDHFDADTSRHYHVVCTECGSVTDLMMDSTPYDQLIDTADADYDGIVQGHVTYFYGVCGNCHKKTIS